MSNPVNEIYVPFTVTGGVSTGENLGVNTLSGFTNRLTKFSFAVSGTHSYAPSAISEDAPLWDMGDGTTVKAVTAQHVYKYPGHYNVSLVVYNSAGKEFISGYTRTITATDFLQDSLQLDRSDVVNVVDIPAGVEGGQTTPIKVDMFNSWQSYNPLSATGYTCSLYASGSKANQLDISRYNNNKWAHIDQRWTFFELLTADDRTENFSPINSVTVNVEPIYYIKKPLKGGDYTYSRVASSILETVSAVSAVFVGTSGTSTFYYGDDAPKVEETPVFLFASVDTSKYPTIEQLIDDDNTQFSDLNYTEHKPLVIPARIRFNSGISIKFTSNGISSMDMTSNKWQCTDIPFYITLEDQYGGFVKSYPSLSLFASAAPGVAPISDAYVVNVSAISASETDTKLLSAHFYRSRGPQLPVSLQGAFRGYFMPFETTDNAVLKGTVNVNDIPSFSKDVYFNYIVNPHQSEIYRHLVQKEYKINDVTGILEDNIKITQLVLPYTQLGATDPVSICVTPVLTGLNENDLTCHITGTTEDLLSSINVYGTAVSAVSCRELQMSDTVVGDGTKTFEKLLNWHKGSDKTRMSPCSLTTDSDGGIWIALSAAAIQIRLLPGDAPSYSFPWPATITNINTYSVNSDYRRGTIVDTDFENNLWVAYTSAGGSIIEKYQRSYTELTTTPSVSYVFERGAVPTDMVTDNAGNVWVTAKLDYTDPAVLAEKNANVRIKTGVILKASPDSDETIHISFNNTTSTAKDVLSAALPGDIVEFGGFSRVTHAKDLYNGRYIVQALSAQSATVSAAVIKPYTGKYNAMGSESHGTVTVNVTARPSDRVYRFDSSANKLDCLSSGILNPTNVVVDKNQEAWITHDANTVTQVNSALSIVQSIPIETDDFITGYADNPTFLWTLSAVTIHLGGISFDTFHNLLVVNSYENKLMRIPVNNRSLSSVSVIASDNVSTSGTHGYGWGDSIARGDWTGFRWINKYTNTTGSRDIIGSSTFNIYPSGGKYKIAKFHEDFDPLETVKSYRLQPFLLDDTVLFDDFLGSIIGSVSSEPTELGKAVYEKIANFLANNADVETCNIRSLYSLAEEVDHTMRNYNFIYPGSLKRIVDLVSISHKKLWGSRSRFAEHFPVDPSDKTNLGAQIPVETGVITAGTRIVAKQLFDSRYKVINPEYVQAVASHIVYASDFSADSDGWTGGNHGNVSSPLSVGGENNTMRLNSTSTAVTTHYGKTGSILTVGKKYKVTGKIYIPSNAANVEKAYFLDGVDYAIALVGSADGTWQSFSYEYTAQRDYISFYMWKEGEADNGQTFSADTTTDFIYLKDIVVIEPDVDPNMTVGSNGYDSTVGMLSSYPLSAFNSPTDWGWNLFEGTSGTDISQQFTFYEYIPIYNNTQIEGIIDWSNPYTNINESQSATSTWYDDNGIVDTLIDYELRQGLGLFSTTLSAAVEGVQ